MRLRPSPLQVRLALLAIAGALSALPFVHGRADAPREPARTPQAWTLDDALAQLDLYPHDAYLQYVALQMGRREDRLKVAAERVERVLAREDREAANRREKVDLFSIFTGALAVQESLQLDTMRRPARNRRSGALAERRAGEIIDVVKLTGPTIKSHPWEKMLGDRKPDIGPLARLVPEDFFLVEFHSVTRMLELIDAGDLWSAHLFNQAAREARTQQIGERLRTQLAIETNRLLRPLYDTVVDEVALTGSDLFLGEGSDVTLLFRTRQPEVFKARMDGFLANAARAHPEAKRTAGEYLGVPYVQLSTPERDVHVFSAYPEPGLHVRSNSRVGLRRVLEAIKGKDLEGKPVRRLGDTTEFAYIRSLMPRGAREEDGFVYLSDPFIRHLVGPTLKLTERRRMLCYNHLRMIGHAALLYRTEFGKVPKTLDDLVRTQCLPGRFNEEDFTCIDGGKYTLSADGTAGVCSHHGHAHNLVPCCETPLAWVTGTEADEYAAFLEEYNNYWRTFFDPIAVRIQATPERYRLETIILPLIDNSIYQGLAAAFNGKPEALDALPVPKRNIFTVAGRINKEHLLEETALTNRRIAWTLGIAEGDAKAVDLVGMLRDGLGNQVALNVYDGEPLFDLDLPNFLGLAFGDLNRDRSLLGNHDWKATFLIASLNSPVYAALPVKDAGVVDRCLERLDGVLTREARKNQKAGWFRIDQDFYTAELKGGWKMRGYGFRLGPVKWRFFWGRVGDALYVASKPVILEDLAAAYAARAEGKAEVRPEAEKVHALVRLRPRNWNQVLNAYRLGWAENNREACLRNLGPMSSVARALRAEKPEGELGRQDKPGAPATGSPVQQTADRLYAVHFFCPEGGRYLPSADGKTCSCSVHGNAERQRQPLAPNEAAGPGKALQNFGGLTATLTFLEDGLHAVLVLDRK
jgi:hypothetical protein